MYKSALLFEFILGSVPKKGHVIQCSRYLNNLLSALSMHGSVNLSVLNSFLLSEAVVRLVSVVAWTVAHIMTISLKP